MFTRNTHITDTERGFSMIEALVAITILSISIAGPMTLAHKGLSSAFLARDQITAFFLAQEAVEYIRNIRDENILTQQNWLSGLGPCVSADGSDACRIDVAVDSVEACSGGTCPPLNYDSTDRLYTYDGGSPSPYTRTVTIEEISGDEVSIQVEISWNTGVLQRSFSVRENLLDWQ